MATFTNKLVKEAIADAEAVRESAIANAKLALEETFTPAIKQLIAKRLKSEADADEKLDRELKQAIAGAPGADAAPAPMGGQTDATLAALDTDPQSQDELDTSKIGNAPNAVPSADAHDTSGIGTVGATQNVGAEFEVAPPEAADATDDAGLEDMGGDFDGDDEETDEFDLDLESIIKELESDIEALRAAAAGQEGDSEKGEESEAGEDDEDEDDEVPGQLPSEFGDEKKDEVIESVPTKSSGIAGGDNKEAAEFTSSGIGASRPSNMGTEFSGSDLETKGSAEKKYEGEEGAAPSGDLKKTSSADTETSHSGKNFVKEGEELDLKEILDELEVSNFEQMTSEITSLQTENAEFRGAIKFLRGKLNEVNLLNAKLLFTNKLFRIASLTNEQKVRIVENIDRTTTVREVKLVYAALAESIGSSYRKVPSRKKIVVTEGSASKATPTAAPSAKVITEVSAAAHRLQQLAGLLKD